MSLGQSTADFAEMLMASMSRWFKRDLASMFRLEATDGPFNLVSKEGSLVSILRINGTPALVTDTEAWALAADAVSFFTAFLQKGGHAIQVFFERDPERAKAEIAQMLERSRAASAAGSLDVADILEERGHILPRHAYSEQLYFVLWSRPALLTKEEAKQQRARLRQNTVGVPPMTEAQDPFRVYDSLRSRHAAFVKAVQSALSKLYINTTLLEVHDGLCAVRASLYPARGKSGWRPYLPGDRYRGRLPTGRHTDVSDVLWPSLASQLLIEDGEKIDNDIVRIGRTLFAPVDLVLAPENMRPFSQLMATLDRATPPMPWRVSYLLEGDGLRVNGMSKMLASIFSFISADNKRIKRAFEDLSEADIANETIVSLRTSFSTWAPADDLDLMRDRLTYLQRSIESWGNCGVNSLVGDPLEGVMSSALSVDCASTAPAAGAPIEEAFQMLPWGRPDSPWQDDGIILFRTRDGKLWPYAPGSRKQTAWIDLVFGISGRGKSVLLNSMNLAVCLASQKSSGGHLPRISIIDIGRSSEGFINLLQEALPPHRREEAVYRRLQMTASNAINPFDTQLGQRRPLPSESEFLINFCTLLATPVGQDAPYDGVAGLLDRAISEVYSLCCDDGSPGSVPKIYTPGLDSPVDDALAQHGIDLPDRTSWWQVVDALFDCGRVREASRAQRHAVPVLMDMLTAMRQPSVASVYGSTMVSATNESVVDATTRMIMEAINRWEILSGPTQIDFGQARVISLDLDLVAKGQGVNGARQTAMVYMLASHIGTRDIFLGRDLLPLIEPKYRAFHERRFQEISETLKRVVFDEFHRTKGAPGTRAQVVVFEREGRKYDVQICLASQALDDFSKDILEHKTGVWILGVGEIDIEPTIKTFNLSPATRDILRYHLNGPQDGWGSPMISKLDLRNGPQEQMLVNAIGPIELWAFSTTPEDSVLRDHIYSRLGPKRGRQLLAREFPSGSAGKEIERRRTKALEHYQAGDATENVIVNLAKEMLARFSQGAPQKPRAA